MLIPKRCTLTLQCSYFTDIFTCIVDIQKNQTWSKYLSWYVLTISVKHGFVKKKKRRRKKKPLDTYKRVALGYCPCELFIKASPNHQSPFLLTIFNTVPLLSFSPFVCVREHFGPLQSFSTETVNTTECQSAQQRLLPEHLLLVNPVQSNYITSQIYFNILQTICMNKTSCPPTFTSNHS